MRAYVINLPKDVVRRSHVEHQCELAGITPIFTYAPPLEDRARGCMMSHRKIWELPFTEPVMVFEDDASFLSPETFQDDLKAAAAELPDTWGMLRMGGVYTGMPDPYSPLLLRECSLIYGTHAYLIHPSYCEELLELPLGREVDVEISTIRPRRRYITSKLLVTQADIESEGRRLREKDQSIRSSYAYTLGHQVPTGVRTQAV